MRTRVRGKEVEDASQQGKFGENTRKPVIIKGIRRGHAEYERKWMTTLIGKKNNIKLK